MLTNISPDVLLPPHILRLPLCIASSRTTSGYTHISGCRRADRRGSLVDESNSRWPVIRRGAQVRAGGGPNGPPHIAHELVLERVKCEILDLLAGRAFASGLPRGFEAGVNTSPPYQRSGLIDAGEAACDGSCDRLFSLQLVVAERRGRVDLEAVDVALRC